MHFQSTSSFNFAEFTLLPRGKNLNCPLHIHREFECYVQTEGSNQVTIDDKKYDLKKGQAVLIFPFQAHSYTPLTENETHVIYIFSSSLVPSYYNTFKNEFPTDNLFSLNLTEEISPKNRFGEKAFTYFLCSEFDQGRKYVDKSTKLKDNYLEKLLLFINSNFTSQCSLRDATAHIGYDYAYLSKRFKSQIGMSFKEYVNLLRISKAKQMLETTDLPICAIAEACGFSSLRSFDREFFSQTGISPTGYRKQ